MNADSTCPVRSRGPRSRTAQKLNPELAGREGVTEDELVRAIFPHLDRSWLGGREYEDTLGKKTTKLHGIFTDAVAGTRRSRICARTFERACTLTPTIGRVWAYAVCLIFHFEGESGKVRKKNKKKVKDKAKKEREKKMEEEKKKKEAYEKLKADDAAEKAATAEARRRTRAREDEEKKKKEAKKKEGLRSSILVSQARPSKGCVGPWQQMMAHPSGARVRVGGVSRAQTCRAA